MTIGMAEYIATRKELQEQLLATGLRLRNATGFFQQNKLLTEMTDIITKLDDLDAYYTESNSCPTSATPR